MLLRLAMRNLRRNRRRTLVTMLGIALGLALLIFSSGFGDGMHNQIINEGVGAMAGHVVVQGAGYQERRTSSLVVPDAPEVERRLRERFPGAVVVPRVFIDGLLTSPAGSAGVGISAVEPGLEAKVNDLHDKITQGGYLRAGSADIVIGTVLARTLDVGVGDKVVLMSQQGADIASRLFRVVGIFQTGLDAVDGFVAQIPLEAGQDLLGLGTAVSQVSLHLQDPKQTREAVAAVREIFAEPSLEIIAWQEAVPELYEYVVLDNGGLYLLLIVIALIVAMGILNTVLMSVLERTREFGVMLSIGMLPRRLAAMVLAEGMVLGFVGSALGIAVGLLLNWPATTRGLDLAAMAGVEEGGMEIAGVQADLMVYSDLAPEKVVLFAAMAVALTTLATLYPAWKASRLRPVDAMRRG